MSSALLNVCVDPRLNHEALRDQLMQRLDVPVPTNRVFVVGEVGGNYGSAARNTIALLNRQRDQIVLAGVLHHDDCLAAAAGMRQAMAPTAKALEEALREAGFRCPVLTGTIITETSTIVWADRPPKSFEVLNFRMPRMYG